MARFFLLGMPVVGPLKKHYKFQLSLRVLGPDDDYYSLAYGLAMFRHYIPGSGASLRQVHRQ